ncbi:MAG: DUF2877 domain-containing protein [Caldisericaceae bacterium]
MGMVAVSVGDCVNLNVLQGRVHTAFREVLNCEIDNSIVSIVTPSIGSGPNNIVVNRDDFDSFGDVQSNFDFSSINFNGAKVFDSRIALSNFDYQEFLSNLNLFERIVIKEGSPLSCAFILDKRRNNFFITPFERNLRDRLRDSYHKFMSGSIEEVNNLKGVGYGLTPQGDDLISGTLVAIYMYGLVKQIDTDKIRNEIYNLAKGENEISNTFLFYASQGRVYEKFKNLLEALISDRNKIYSSAMRFLDIGETSGADLSTGFIISMKKLFEGGLPW